MDIKYRRLKWNEIEEMSKQLKISYTHAYRNLMDSKYLDSITDKHWIPYLEKSMKTGETCLVAEYHQKIIGSTVFTTVIENDVFARWHAFYLLPEFIGQGIGHNFYKKIEKEMKEQGCQYCLLEVLSNNQKAKHFYTIHGYKKIRSFTVKENGVSFHCDEMLKNFP